MAGVIYSSPYLNVQIPYCNIARQQLREAEIFFFFSKVTFLDYI